jgi:hypothetical protein
VPSERKRDDRPGAFKELQVTLTFHFRDSGIAGIRRLSRTTGKVEDAPLTPGADKGRYLLELDLDGGSADLFKFNTGVAFVH